MEVPLGVLGLTASHYIYQLKIWILPPNTSKPLL